jgi:hypothetical protein
MLTPSRFHWYPYVGTGVPNHVPVVQESVCPTVAVPEATGATVFAGINLIVPNDADVALAEPEAFVAVTVTVISAAVSNATSVYVLAVAPLILAPARFH